MSSDNAREIVNSTMVTPQRVHTLIKLIASQPSNTQISREQVCQLMQPQHDTAGQVKENISVCIRYGWLAEDADGLKLGNKITKEVLGTKSTFQEFLYKNLIGFRAPHNDDYRMNMLLAWFIANNERVLLFDSDEKLALAFDNEVLSETIDTDGHGFNKEKYSPWIRWMTYLDYGWLFKGKFIPDATKRIDSVLGEVIEVGENLGIEEFLKRLSRKCPELDGGELFELCRHHTTSSHNTLSMVLSQSLRTLHYRQIIELRYTADADYVEQLYPMSNQVISQISDITLGASA